MQGEIPVGDQRIPYEFVEKQGVRNIYLRFYGEKLMIVAPRRWLARPVNPESIIREHKDWIVKHHAQVRGRKRIFDKNYTLYLGKRYLTVFAIGGRSIEINHDAIIIRAESRGAADRMMEKMLVEETKRLLPRLTLQNAMKIGETVGEIKFRRAASRWGSCSSKRTITFNSYLSALPVELAEYVAAHEVAHLREMNHSPAFWKVVASLCPDYKAKRKELSTYENRFAKIVS